MKYTRLIALAVVAALTPAVWAVSAEDAIPDSDKQYVNVVKLMGIGWFELMEEGIAQWSAETGIKARQIGADDATPEKQVKLVEELIDQSVTAITVIPNSPESLEGAFAKAQAAAIKVVTHEAPSQKNANADIEAFDNVAYGETMMDHLAECMGGSGKYAAFVGHVTAESHMQWVTSSLARAQARYPNISRVEDPIESLENTDTAYEKAKELLKRHPDLKGIQSSSAASVVGVGRAVEELGLNDRICVMGTSIPSLAGEYLKTGAIDKIFFWDPVVAGKAIMTVADLLVDGKALKPGMDLGLPGYESLRQSPENPTTWYGSAWIIVDKHNATEYPF